MIIDFIRFIAMKHHLKIHTFKADDTFSTTLRNFSLVSFKLDGVIANQSVCVKHGRFGIYFKSKVISKRHLMICLCTVLKRNYD